MKDILLSDFAAGYGLTRQVPVLYAVFSGSFSLNDSKACADCKEDFRTICDKIVLKIESDNVVTKIDFETFINGSQNKISGGRCDYLLYDDNKIALIELTCRESKYLISRLNNRVKIEGKQERAYKQIRDSIDKLIRVESIKNKVLGYSNRIGLFAYKIKDISFSVSDDDKVAERMKVFTEMTVEIDSLNLSTDMGDGFQFVKVGYPDSYKW